MPTLDDYRNNVKLHRRALRLALKSDKPFALKTEAYYNRALDRDVRDFYAGEIDEGEFIDEMIRLIEGQFTRAWNEGARDVGFDPKEMTDEDLDILQEKIDAELEFVLDYTQAINDAASNGDPIEPLRDRVRLWTNRYNEIANDARIYFGGKKRLVWRLGATEDHCSTCATLDGVVATAEDWDASGLHPQGAPNERLECGGWRCDCSLDITDEPLTDGGIPVV